jgi:hypothetical protein
MYLENDEVEKYGLTTEPRATEVSGCNGCVFDDEDEVHGLCCHNVRCLEPNVIWVKREDYHPARNTDPDTSHRAAIAATTRRASIKDHILIELAVHGGCTGEEIANRTTLRLNSITPRFAELTRAGKIKDSGTTRNKQIVWVLT